MNQSFTVKFHKDDVSFNWTSEQCWRWFRFECHLSGKNQTVVFTVWSAIMHGLLSYSFHFREALRTWEQILALEQGKYLITKQQIRDKKVLSVKNLTHKVITIIGHRTDFDQILPKGFLSTIYSVFIKYLPSSIVVIYFQVHRASIAGKLHNRRPFYTKSRH